MQKQTEQSLTVFIPSQRAPQEYERFCPKLKPAGKYLDYIKSASGTSLDALYNFAADGAAGDFRTTTLETIPVSSSDRLSLDAQALKLIANIPIFIESQRKLDALSLDHFTDGKSATRKEKLPHLISAIRFNHALKDMIDSNQQLGREAMIVFVTGVALRLVGEEGAYYARDAVKRVLTGMTHELIAEQALWQLPTVSTIFEPETEEQAIQMELSGIDIIAELTDGSVLPIDVAGSKRGEEKKLATRRSSDENYPFWTGVNSSSFGDTIRGSNKQVEIARERLLTMFAQLR